MQIDDTAKLFQSLLAARTPAAISEILRLAGSTPDTDMDVKFGPLGLQWHAFGNKPSNFSTIGLATKPGRSLTERLTNAMDALLELKASRAAQLPKTPRESAKLWFGRPMSGPDSGLFQWDYSANDDDRHVLCVLHGDNHNAPAVDVLDDGIGITASEFAKTILSLQEGNKISKWYLIGSFGQGGASTLAFCDCALFVSRPAAQPNRVAFTVVAPRRLGDQYKEDCYAYLALVADDGAIDVPSVEVDLAPLPLHQLGGSKKEVKLLSGTLVRHFGYRLEGVTGALGPQGGNLYHFLHCALFDPLLPFRLVDLRTGGTAKDELVTGSRNRLMKLVQSKQDSDEEEDEGAGSEIALYRPMEYVQAHGGLLPSLGIEYWVVLNYRKVKGQVVLRSQSNELYVEKGRPIIFTMNGQNQGDLGPQVLKDCGLNMVARHIVVHVDATRVETAVRRGLFSTNREGIKDGPELTSIINAIREMLSEDEQLQQLEQQLTDKLLSKETANTRQEVKKQVASLLRAAGFVPKSKGAGPEPSGGTEKERVRKPRHGRPIHPDPLPTLPYPGVTNFKIAVPKEKLSVKVASHELVLVETDADAEYDRQGRIAIRFEPAVLEVKRKSALKGGRVRWVVQPSEAAVVGESGTLTVSITQPDGRQLSDSREFIIEEALEVPVKAAEQEMPDFDVVPIDPDSEPARWAQTWPDIGDDEDSQKGVAYKVYKSGDRLIIFYSTIFSAFADQVKTMADRPGVLEAFKVNYEIWVAYHAILQDKMGNEAFGDGDTADKLEWFREEERACVAKVQVKECVKLAEMQVAVAKTSD